MNVRHDLSWREYSDALDDACRARRIPLGATFELTPLCNFACQMCYVRLTKGQMEKQGRLRTAGEWLALGREAQKAGSLYLLLTGGEIFAREDFREIYMGLSGMGFLITLYTNGYLLTEETIGWLKECPPIRLRITLYGASDATYEKVCGVKDGFTVVSRNIDRLREAGIRLEIAMTVICDNAQDLEAVTAYAQARETLFTYTFEIVKPVRDAVSRAVEVRFAQGGLADAVKRPIQRVDALYPGVTNNALDVCGSRDRCYWVMWDGRMSICSFINTIHENPFEKGLEGAWADLCDRLARIRKPKQCIDCRYMKFCIACPGVLEAETGDPEKLDPAQCMKARERYERYAIDAAHSV